jgi:ABC-type antimicrobial peptide transport system permease subunit
MALVGGALLIVAVIAAAGPSRSVLRIDPTISLRAE